MKIRNAAFFPRNLALEYLTHHMAQHIVFQMTQNSLSF